MGEPGGFADCLGSTATVDVVQGIRTGPVEQTGRGVVIVGVTTKVVSV